MSKVLIWFNFFWPFRILFVVNLLFVENLYSQASVDASALVDTKELTIEWEPVRGSFGYEIDIHGLGDNGFVPLGRYKVKSTQWSSNLNPGKYQFRIRALDARGVPGLWGDYIPFTVTVPPPVLIKPLNAMEFKTEQVSEANVEFEWKPVNGATAYVLEIFPNTDGQPAVFRAEFPEAKGTASLAVGKKYRWQVYSIDIQRNAGDPVKTQFIFSLIGKKIEPPEIEKPESEYVNKISWKLPKGAEKFSYILQRKNTQKNEWVTLEKNESYDKSTVAIHPKYKGGSYRLRVLAQGTLRPSSDAAMMEFPVYNGERTPKAMEIAKLRRAMERDNDNYLIASYLISSLSYTGDNKETGNRVAYTVLGGTGRLGYGYMPKKRWGFVSIVDLGGLNLRNKNYTFASAEVHAVWRRYLGVSTQLRLFGGLFVREIPEAKAFDVEDVTVKNIQQLGPLLGMQFWMSFNYKYGLQVNAQVNLAALKLSTPNGRNLIPSTCTQLGVMGSYKMRENLTGFAGVAHRVDKSSYEAKPYTGGSELNFASSGDINSVTMTGTYLNLYAEWGF